MLTGSAWVAGCTCADTGAIDNRFVCLTSEQCAEGYFCDFTGECIRNGGSMGGGMGGGAGGGGVGGGGGEPDAGSLQLVITSPAQTLAVGSCSAPITFEVRNGLAVTGVPVSTPVSISATPSGVLGLFSGAGCTGALPLTLAPDASSGAFSFFAGDGGTYDLALSAMGLAGANQLATATYPPITGLVFLTAAQAVRAGDCSAAITVELRDATNAPAKASVPAVIDLSSTPTPGVLFFSDAACGSAITQTTIPVGSSRATVYVERATGFTYTLTASLGTRTATLSHDILPVVRSGTCVLGDADGGVACPVTPPVLLLSDSFLVYQVASSTHVAGAAAVQCELTSLSSISCRRGQLVGDALVHWQVAEVKGATVRKVQTPCDGGLSVSLGGVSPANSSFVLTANENDGNTVDESDFNIARLNDAGTAVDFDFGGGCTGNQSMVAQVVTLPNLVVTRGTNSFPATSALRTFADPPPPMAGMLLAQWRTNIAGPGICDRVIRPELMQSSVTFSRANGSGNAFCTASAIASLLYEEVDFRATATVQQVTLTMAVGATTASPTLTAVDRTRTLVLTGAQGSAGQSLGEGTLTGTTSTTDVLGDVSVALSLGGMGYQSTTLTARRNSSLGASRWTAYVVELIP